MIKEILRLMSQGNSTYNEISRELKIGYNELINRLEMMERMKYIEEVSSENCNMNLACACCPISKKSCSDANSKYESTIIYRITNKGKKVCGV